MPIVTLIRHAEPELTGVLLGATDCPLSTKGHATASQRLHGLSFAAVYVSPMRRARETAAALSQVSEIVENLREISLGDWDGLTWAEVERRDPERASRKLAAWFDETPPNGEPWPDFVRRVSRAWEHIRRGPFPAAIVAHVTVNACLRLLLAGDDPATFQQAYCEPITYEF